MADILDGNWNSFVLRDNQLTRDDNPSFHLEVEAASGDLKPTSLQGSHKLKGKINRGNQVSVTIQNEDQKHRYDGLLCARLPTTPGQARLVLCGILTLNKPGKTGAGTAVINQTQEQIIWIATKP